jgi:hypothetical protein
MTVCILEIRRTRSEILQKQWTVDSSQWTVEEGRVLIIIAKREAGEFADAARTGKKTASGEV